MESTDKYIQLEKELDIYRKMMSEASEVILAKEVTKYPIFIAHQQQLDMGLVLLERSKSSAWTIVASTLEEFVTKQIIFQDRLDDFIKNFKDPTEYLCVFVLSELGAQFVYLRRYTA